MIINVKNGEIDTIVDGSKVVLMEFHGKNCPECQRMEQVLSDLNNHFLPSNLIIAKMDVSDKANRQVAIDMGLSSVPHLILYKNGAVVMNRAGFAQLNDLVKTINAAYV